MAQKLWVHLGEKLNVSISPNGLHEQLIYIPTTITWTFVVAEGGNSKKYKELQICVWYKEHYDTLL